MTRCTLLIAVLVAAPIGGGTSFAGELTITSVEPPINGLNAGRPTSIVVQFDQPVDPDTFTSDDFNVFGKWSGPAEGTFQFSNSDQTVTMSPDLPFFAGELVRVRLSHNLMAANGSPLRPGGFTWQFWTRSEPAALKLTELDVVTTNIAAESSRPYGGIASDLNNDGWADLTMVNEDTADVRVFLNRADGTGLVHDVMQPTFPVNIQASPSEPGDFNRDGNVDMCVCNISTDTISILLGNGNGTFGPHQQISVGNAPRGIAVLDVDGDGDTDIVTANFSDSNLSLLLNDGNGVFGAPSTFEGGGSGEWGLASADMNNDGIFDLVVGLRNSQTVVVQLGNGDGTFTAAAPQSIGGGVWMIMCGDLNGDGNEDVTVANGPSANGAILLGNGDGTLQPPDTHSTDPTTLATDIGDLDGDGDLDWVTSSFSGDWRLFTNDGDGNFTFLQEIPAPDAASCALLVDLDNDFDLDLALVDENDDLIILMSNSGTAVRGDVNGDGVVNPTDIALVLGAWGPCRDCVNCPADLNDDCTVNAADLAIVLGNWS